MKGDWIMNKKLIFHVSNLKVLVLLAIVTISTGIATYLQFVKGSMFQEAVSQNFSSLQAHIFLFALLMCIEVFFYYIEWRYENYVVTHTFYQLKKGVISNALKFSSESDHLAENETTQLLTNSIDSLEFPYYNAWFDNIYLSLRVVFVFLAITAINIWIALALLILMGLPLLVTQLFKNKLSTLNKRYINQVGKNLSLYENLIVNLNPIHIFEVREYFLRKVTKSLRKEKDFEKESKAYQYGLNASYSFISYLSSFVVLVASLLLISHGQIKLGSAVTLLGLVDQLSLPILSLSRNTSTINSTKSVRSDIEGATLATIAEREMITPLERITTKNLAVEIKDKKLSYQDFTFEMGSSYVIRGNSGAGKTVFLKMLTALRTFDEGNIEYDESDIGRNADKNVFKDMRYVQAENNLFDDTVLKNIFFDRDPSQAELQNCQKLLKPEALLADSPENLSTGEIRRVLLLRGLLAEKSMLVFDEPTANLDTATSAVFWKMLFDWFKDGKKTLIVISHTIDESALANFDHSLDFNKVVKSD